MSSNSDKWTAFLNDDWDKPSITTTAVNNEAKIQVKTSNTTGSKSMDSYYNNTNSKPKLQILKKQPTQMVKDNDKIENKKQDTLTQDEKLLKYEEIKRQIFNDK